MKYIVTTEWLAEHLNDDNLCIVDVRGKVLPASEPPPHYFSHHEDYAESHILGAVFVDWTTDIVAPNSPSYDIAPPDQYAELIGKLGIGDTTSVVAYDDAGGMFAARFLWTLRYYGHDNVALLDGGWQKWCEESRPVTSEVPEIEFAAFTPKVQSELRVTADDILNKMKSDNLVLLDARSIAEFNGESSRAKRKGHIPQAVHLSRRAFLTEDMTVLPLDIARSKAADVGISDAADEIIVYCNSGVSASYVMLALNELGYENVSLYDGSWKDWGNDETKPIQT